MAYMKALYLVQNTKEGRDHCYLLKIYRRIKLVPVMEEREVFHIGDECAMI